MTGDEINSLVARKLGWEKLSPLSEMWTRTVDRIAVRRAGVPDYCHSIAAAWDCVNHLRNKTDYFYFTLESTSGMTVSLWSARFSKFNPPFAGDLEGEAATPEMAICLALLKLP